MKNVMFFTHSLSGGGAEKTVRTVSNYINRHDYGLKSYVCVVYDSKQYHDQVDNLVVLNVKSQRDDSKVKKAVNVFRQIAEVRAIKKKLKIDVCISFLPGADIINVFSGVGEKKIVSVRNKESLFTHNIFKKIYVKTSYLLCDKIVAVSNVVRKDVIDFFGIKAPKVVTIHNAVSDFNGQSSEIKPEVQKFIDGNRVIVNVGRLAPEKGQVHLIRAFAMIHEQIPDVKLLILGEGDLRGSLQKLIDELKISESVLLAGSVPNPSAYLRKANAFVLSSDVEGIPNVLLEALLCGLPCISTECGAREILSPDTDPCYETKEIEYAKYGVLIPACGGNDAALSGKNEAVMAKAIKELLGNEEACRNYMLLAEECTKAYSMEQIAGEWDKVLKDCFG